MRKPDVIVPPNHPNPPEPHEIEAAWILARHYSTAVEFLVPIDGYGIKTPDFVMDGVLWELKSPLGKSRNTIGNQFMKASRQSRHIIIDAQRTRIDDDTIITRIRLEMVKNRKIKKVLIIKKSQKVVEISS
ncbi:MAG: hypothetical protein LBL23_04160 [Coriobacteriales bacterium]|jgi:hypothetical protein|nr:hypothetical protein [Coriobacteriales bacterium]